MTHLLFNDQATVAWLDSANTKDWVHGPVLAPDVSKTSFQSC